jgi:TonB family protein
MYDVVQRRLSSQDTFLRAAALALRVTNANGAAVALNQGGEMLCCAASGKLAPPVGSRLAGEVGLSKELLHGSKSLRCDDTEKDFRVDRKACRNLGIRSVVVVPVQMSDKVVAILEIFSDRPGAFGGDQIERLQSVADMVAGALLDREGDHPPVPGRTGDAPRVGPLLVEQPGRALDPPRSQQEESLIALSRAAEGQLDAEPWRPVSFPVAAQEAESSIWVTSGFRLICFSLVFAAGLVALVFGSTRIYQHPALKRLISGQSLAGRAGGPSPGTGESSPSNVSADAPGATRSFYGRAAKPSPAKLMRARRASGVHGLIPSPGSNGVAEVARRSEPPAREPVSPGIGSVPSTVRLSQVQQAALTRPDLMTTTAGVSAQSPAPVSLSGGRLIHRVEPVYPASARLHRLQGVVTLRAVVKEDGTLEKVGLISGNPVLAPAAIDAVAQWRYEPYSSNGQPVRTPIQITVDFKLPAATTTEAVAP